MTQVPLGNVLHLAENHSADLLRCKLAHSPANVYLDDRFVTLACYHLEGHVLQVCLDAFV